MVVRRKKSTGAAKKPSKSVIKLAKKYKVKITIKRGSKRVYKTTKLILQQVRRKKKNTRRTRKVSKNKFGGSLFNLFKPNENTPELTEEELYGIYDNYKQKVNDCNKIREKYRVEYVKNFPNRETDDFLRDFNNQHPGCAYYTINKMLPPNTYLDPLEYYINSTHKNYKEFVKNDKYWPKNRTTNEFGQRRRYRI
jgi:hypothetical protein